MIYGLYESAAGMMTNEYRQGVLANNIANAETVGFKRDVMAFAERVPAAEAGRRNGPAHKLLDELGGGVWLGRTYTDFSEGPIQQTGIPYDVSLAGPGFFVVRDASGRELLTRDGRFVADERGQLRTVDGAEVLSAGGGPLFMNPRGDAPTIDESGRIAQGGAFVGQLALADVEDYDGLLKVGAARFMPAIGQETVPALARVRQGYIEGSGVEPVREMTAMMESARAYQFNARMVSLQDETAGRLINSVQG